MEPSPLPVPTPQQVRRAVTRAERGAALDVPEATALLAARGADLDRLTTVAARVRDAGLVAAGRRGVVTYSPKVFVPVARLCRDRCHYCTFVETPAQAEREGRAPYLTPEEIVAIAREGATLGCLEALFTPGDRLEARWPEAQAWLNEQGYDSTLAYVRAMAVRVLEETGLLPHLNPGTAVRAHLLADLPGRGRASRPHAARQPRRPCHGPHPAPRGRVAAGGIRHVQTSWVKLGIDGSRAMLQSGADDLGGTLMEETISRMAGSEHGSAKTVADLVDIGAGIGRPVRERTTTYGVPAHRGEGLAPS
jgi:2-iminoacetate synthase ThiH